MLFSKPKENKTEDGKMFDMRKIGKRIAELRKSKNITQMALADMMGISFQAVSNWERGESMPDISKLGELSEIFGVSIDDILCNKRAAEIVEEISAGEKPSDITPEELTETVPLMAPKQAEESIKENKNKMTISQLAALAPFMNEDDTGERSLMMCMHPFLRLNNTVSDECEYLVHFTMSKINDVLCSVACAELCGAIHQKKLTLI